MRTFVRLLKRRPNFRRLWLGNAISLAGDWIGWIAISLIALHGRGGVIDLAVAFLAHHLPVALLAPIGGILADRYDRRRLLLFVSVIQALLTACMVLALSAELMAAIQGLLALRSALTAIYTPTERAILPQTVNKEELRLAGTIDSATWSIVFCTGMALGGALTALGPSLALTIDSLSFLFAAWFFFRLPAQSTKAHSKKAHTKTIDSKSKTKLKSTNHASPIQKSDSEPISNQQPAQDEEKREGSLGPHSGLLEVFVWLWNHPYTMRAALAKAPLAMASGAGWIAVNELASSNNGIEKSGMILGLLLAIRGAGTGIGPLLGNAFLRRGGRETVIWMAFLAIGLASISILVNISSWWWLTIVSLMWGMGGGANWVFSSVIVQRSTPDRIMGRVSGIETLSWVGCQSLAVLATAWPRHLGVSIAESARPSILLAIVWIALLQLRVLWVKRSYNNALSPRLNVNPDD